MARRLPWVPTSEATKSQPKRRPATRAPKLESSSSGSETSKRAAGPAQAKAKVEDRSKKKHRSRSLSTSPIRGPPTVSPMRPGYDQDDIYIMVEDELQAVAQTFTHHLHAAEFKRLKKKAREAPPQTLPVLSPGAPKDVKRKFEVMSMQRKQRAALDEEGEEKTGPRDPWLGTSLAGLMGRSSQPKRALLGSQEIQSSTRAASGFGRGESESPSKRLKTSPLDKNREPKPEPALDIPNQVQPILGNVQRFQVSEHFRVVDGVRVPVSKADDKIHHPSASELPKATTSGSEPKSGQPRPRPAQRPARKKFNFDDDFDIDSISTPEPEPEKNLEKPIARRKAKVEVKEESKTTNFSDIPTFLIA